MDKMMRAIVWNGKPWFEGLSYEDFPVPEYGAKKKRLMFQGELPSPLNPPSGCRLHTRCPYATDACVSCEQELRDVGNGHFVACARLEELRAAQT